MSRTIARIHAKRGRIRTTTILLVGLTSFLVGLAAARRFSITGYWYILGIALCIPLLFRRSILSVLSICVIGLVFGLVRGTIFLQLLLPYQTYAQKVVTIRGHAKTDAIYADKGQIEFDVGNVMLIEPQELQLPGVIDIRGYGEPMIHRDDEVEVRARLYPARGSRQARMSFSQLKRVHTDTSHFNRMRQQAVAGMLSSLPEPHGSLALGIVIGQRTTLPKNLVDDLSITGLTHIVAVSGYNLTIIINAVRRLLKNRSKFQSTVITITLVSGFLLITGLSASIVRAALVSMLSIWAGYFGRSFRPVLLIVLAASITAGWYPPYLWSDLGWYLSFLAFFGVLVITPLFQARFLKRKPKIFLQLCIETTAAQIMTLPVILLTFGRLSLIALPANMLVVPLVPLSMALTIIAGCAGLLLPALAGWFSWPGVLLMTYMVDMIGLLSRVPGASIQVYLLWWHVGLAYGAVMVTLYAWWRKASKNGKIVPIQTVTSSI